MRYVKSTQKKRCRGKSESTMTCHDRRTTALEPGEFSWLNEGLTSIAQATGAAVAPPAPRRQRNSHVTFDRDSRSPPSMPPAVRGLGSALRAAPSAANAGRATADGAHDAGGAGRARRRRRREDPCARDRKAPGGCTGDDTVAGDAAFSCRCSLGLG